MAHVVSSCAGAHSRCVGVPYSYLERNKVVIKNDRSPSLAGISCLPSYQPAAVLVVSCMVVLRSRV